MNIEIDAAQLADYFEWLDELRAGGTVNMFGASVEVQSEFGLSKKEARWVVQKWMTTFGDETALQRSQTALSS